jgi:hypothetical protein
VIGLRAVLVSIRITAIVMRPANGGPKLVAPTSDPADVPVDADAAVVRVKVADAAAAPGVTLAGANEAVHLVGSPAQLKEAGESNDPNWGVSVIV